MTGGMGLHGIAPRHWADDDPVILRPRLRDVPVPRFGNDAWNLSCTKESCNQSPVTLHFSNLPPDRKLTAKEMMARRLNEPSASSRRNRVVKGYAALTCEAMLNFLRAVFAFMDANGIGTIQGLVQDDLDAFHAQLAERLTHEMSRASALQVFVWLWELRDDLTHGGLTFDPWNGRSTIAIAGYVRPDVNATRPVPPKVMSGLLRMAMAYVDDFAGDVIAAERDYSDGTPAPSGGGAPARFAAYVRERRKAGLGLPATVHIGEVKSCQALIAKRAAIPRAWLHTPPGRVALRRAWGDLGPDLACLAPPRHVPAGRSRPWRDAMTIEDMKLECRNLTAAAYLVTAYLSGMRDSEVQDLRRGCIEAERDERGLVVRYRIRGRTFKHRKRPEPRTWVVIEPVARAIGVLERMTEGYHARTGDDHLFVRLHYETKSSALFKEKMNPALRALAAHWNEVLVPRQDGAAPSGGARPTAQPAMEAVPNGPEGPWHLKASQLRRTLAWHIANQPFGEIACMIQFGHAYVQITEGYCGSLEDGFRDEVAKARFLARIGDLTDMMEESSSGVQPAGPMAAELKAVFQEVAAVIGPFPGKRADDKRVRELLRNKAGQMRVGLLAHCFFVPGRARCLRHLEVGERVEPVNGLCDPNCQNACWTKDHVGPWQELEAEAGRLSRLNRISEPQRTVLESQRAQAAAIVRAIREARGGQG